MRAATPRRAGQLGPVPLLLLAGRMGDVDGLASLDTGARLAARPQPPAAQRAGEAGVAARRAQRDHLVVQGARPHVAVLGQPRRRVVDERGEPTGCRASALAGGALAVQVGTDRLGVTVKMAGGRGDRPALRAERGCLHVFLPCEHGAGLLGLRRQIPQASGSPTPCGGPCRPPGGSERGDSVSRPGEFQTSTVTRPGRQDWPSAWPEAKPPDSVRVAVRLTGIGLAVAAWAHTDAVRPKGAGGGSWGRVKTVRPPPEPRW